MRNYTWTRWWRSSEGVVTQENGFYFDDDPDWVYFGIDPEAQHQQLEDNDPRRKHVDGLFDTADEAAYEAITFLEERIKTYQHRLIVLARGLIGL